MKKIFLSALLCLNFGIVSANPCDCNDTVNYDAPLCNSLYPTLPECQDGSGFFNCADCLQKVLAQNNPPTQQGSVGASVPVDDHLWVLALAGFGYAFYKLRK